MKHEFSIIEMMIAVAIITILAAIIIPGFLTFKCHAYGRSLEISNRDIKVLCDKYSSNSNMKNIIAEVAKGRLSVEDALSMSNDDYIPQDVPAQKLENNNDGNDAQIQILNNKIELLESQLNKCTNNDIQINESDRTWKD